MLILLATQQAILLSGKHWFEWTLSVKQLQKALWAEREGADLNEGRGSKWEGGSGPVDTAEEVEACRYNVHRQSYLIWQRTLYVNRSANTNQ